MTSDPPAGWSGMASLYTVLDEDGRILWRGPKADLRALVLACEPARREVEAAGFRKWLGKGRYAPDAGMWTGYVPPRQVDDGRFHVAVNESPVRAHLLAAVKLALDERRANAHQEAS